MTTPQIQDAAILKRLLVQQQEGLFTDLEVRLQDGSDHVSRNLFAALSDPFRNMLAHDMVEGRERVVRFDYLTLDAWRCVFQFYYAKQDLLNESNIYDVLAFSHMYHLHALQERCSCFLSERCSVDNCLKICRTANTFSLNDLRRKSLETIAANFLQIGKQEKFLELTLEEVLAILDEENLMTTEDELCWALLRWLKKQDTCEGNVLAIFDNIFVERLSYSLIEQLLKTDQLHKNTSFYCRLLEQQMKILEPAAPRISRSTPCRRGHPQENTVVVGHAGGQLFICCWSLAEKKWSTLCKMWYPRGFSSVKVEDTIFITGGYSSRRRTGALKRTTLFSLKSRTRSQGPVLNDARYGHSMAVVGKEAFVVGGLTDQCQRRSIEMYDRTRDQWQIAGKLQTPRGVDRVFGVVALGNKLAIAVSIDVRLFTWTIQLFDVITKTTSTLSCQLPPLSLQLCCGVSFGDAACLVDTFGYVFLLKKKDDSISLEQTTRLHNFVPRFSFGLTFDGACLSVHGGEDAVSGHPDLHSTVNRLDLQGQEVEKGDLECLPLKMRVHGVFHWRPDKFQA